MPTAVGGRRRARAVGDATQGLNATFTQRLRALMDAARAATGRTITITSGFRSTAQQAALYRQKPNLAAPPGKSNHEKGIAADLADEGKGDGPALRWMHANAAKFGLDFPMAPGRSKKVEPWHVELAEGNVPADNSYANVPTGPVEDRNSIGTQLSDFMSLLNPEVQRQPEMTQPQQPSQTGQGDAESWIREAMRITGVGEDWLPGLRARMMQESGGRNIPQGIVDVNTRKGTPAFGPMQVIEPTFRANALPGYEDWKNPLHNTVAAIQYIKRRYGHPSRLPKGGY